MSKIISFVKVHQSEFPILLIILTIHISLQVEKSSVKAFLSSSIGVNSTSLFTNSLGKCFPVNFKAVIICSQVDSGFKASTNISLPMIEKYIEITAAI